MAAAWQCGTATRVIAASINPTVWGFQMIMSKTLAASCFAIVMLAPVGNDAWPQTTRTIKLVVAVAPGGTSDTIARLLADQIGRTQGVTMIVENRPGAGTVIATEAVSRATPDGNTILLMASSFVINPHLKKLAYDPLASFEPICQLTRSPHLVLVSDASPYRTLAELLDAARAKPGELTMASNGPATGQHIAFEMLKRAAGIDMTYVPYSGGVPVINTLLGNHVTAAIADYGDAVQQLKAGKLRPLATASRARIELLPEVPTIAEAGYKDFEVEGSQGIVAPAKTPKESIAQLIDWFTVALQTPMVTGSLEKLGLISVRNCGSQFADYLRKRYEEYGRIIREAHIKAR
jgi:tripartite-type tricarboxylate transporter receptor subunit TctC